MFGAIGEELLFRGYGFQTLARIAGSPGSLAVTAILFGSVHMQNLHATPLGIINTAGFGVVFGYAFLRTGELWLPIGLHFGWNWMLSLAGAAVSGFKMGITGYQLRWKVAEIWSGGEYGPEASVLTCVVIIVLLVLIHKLPLRHVEAPLLTMREPHEVSPEA
jgi:membrane protease YdiL (CAAX protease family)